MNIDELFAGKESPHQLDMKLNFKKFFQDSKLLSPKEAGLVTLACAESMNAPKLIQFALGHLEANGATPEEIQEGKDAGGHLASNAAEDSHHTDGPAVVRGVGRKRGVSL